MRVGIITFHFVNNFGGALQAYALQKTIADECTVSTEIIDYRNWFIRFTDTVRLFPITMNMKEIVSGLRTMKQRFGRVYKMRKFMVDNCKLTRQYNSNGSLRRNVPDCDKFVCGSDQIWNPMLTLGVAKPYFLEFVKEKNRKIAYAPSFGSNRLVEGHIGKIKKYLEDFKAVSTREYDSVNLIKNMIGQNVEQLIDPVFLLHKEEWNAISIVPQVKEKYILLYIMQHDDSIYEYVKKIKEKMGGIQVVEISRYGYKPDFVDVSLIDIGPGEFVGLFQNAEYICTNSYHGLIYSLVFEKEFCLIPCKKFYLRVSNLLKLLQIEQADVLNTEDVMSAVYDRETVRRIVEKERQKAIQYLQNNIVTEG